jgi:hypothetical protein
MLKPVLRIRILDPGIFVIDLQDDSKKLIFKHNFFYLLLLEATFRHFSKIKSKKIVGFKVYYFGMITEGFGSGEGSGSGTIPLTSGSGSWMPKNMWIRLIRIRIRNTGWKIGKIYRKAMKKTTITLHRLVALTGGSSSPSAHLPAAMFGGGGMFPRKELIARATEVCRITLKTTKLHITGF